MLRHADLQQVRELLGGQRINEPESHGTHGRIVLVDVEAKDTVDATWCHGDDDYHNRLEQHMKMIQQVVRDGPKVSKTFAYRQAIVRGW